MQADERDPTIVQRHGEPREPVAPATLSARERERRERLAAALRANLSKRKQQVRARRLPDGEG